MAKLFYDVSTGEEVVNSVAKMPLTALIMLCFDKSMSLESVVCRAKIEKSCETSSLVSRKIITSKTVYGTALKQKKFKYGPSPVVLCVSWDDIDRPGPEEGTI